MSGSRNVKNKIYLTFVNGSRIVVVMKGAALSREMREYLAKLGKKGGLKGGPARASKMSAEERSASARAAVQARWSKAKSSTVR